MAAAPMPLDLDDLDSVDLTGLALSPLALAAELYWEAGLHGRARLCEGLTVAATDWANTLQGLALVGHPRVRALAQSRADGLGAAIDRHLTAEAAR